MPLLPEYPSGKPGRPWRSNREALDAILCVLRTGAPWRDLPEKYHPYQTCHRRFKVERFFSWLEDFRRLVVRWEYHAELYLGVVLLTCIRILLN